MFRKFLLIVLSVIVAFFIEYSVFHLGIERFVPQFTLLVVIFFSLAFGIRYGIFTAVWAGIVKESLAIGFFGFHFLTFVICAYLTVILKKYVYHSHSRFARLLLVFLIMTVYYLILGVLYFMADPYYWHDAVFGIILPQATVTLIVSNSVFQGLKRCVLKFFA